MRNHYSTLNNTLRIIYYYSNYQSMNKFVFVALEMAVLRTLRKVSFTPLISQRGVPKYPYTTVLPRCQKLSGIPLYCFHSTLDEGTVAFRLENMYRLNRKNECGCERHIATQCLQSAESQTVIARATPSFSLPFPTDVFISLQNQRLQYTPAPVSPSTGTCTCARMQTCHIFCSH